MKRKFFHLFFILLFFLFTSSFPSYAQNTYGKRPDSRHRYDTMRGTVLVFSPKAITVRDSKRAYYVHTFSYDERLLPRVQKKHYKWGDRVKVKFLRGTDTAVEVK